ncbi:MAG: DUF2235 domain-containing protein [Gammaproteobacteria bacterium]|nr:DUF2235 domain-containing protein [Gammaproteobacteria bacterium]
MEKKRIILCCDGTWNEAERLDNESRQYATNVLKTVRALSPVDEATGIQQLIFYQPGIGTSGVGQFLRTLGRFIGGCSGLGISRNIQDCYRFLANNYVPGDEIYLFGFSRGAYTARSLAGMIGSVGLLRKSDMDLLPEVYEYYRTAPEKRDFSPYHERVVQLDRRFPKIRFLGVWDTVGALGLPVPGLQHLSRKWVGFHDTHLGRHVEHAYHAVAIDERRRPFKPAMWTRLDGQISCQQVWFSGVHSNIGGGYADHGLSDVALMWLVKRAQRLGLRFNETYLFDAGKVIPDAMDKLEDSFTLPYKFLQWLGVLPYRRPIGEEQNQNEMIHESVIRRILEEPDYRPVNLLPHDPSNEMYPLVSFVDQRNVLQVKDKQVPVFRERQYERVILENCPATLIDEQGLVVNCDILDYSDGGGARVQMESLPTPGTMVSLDSRRFGLQEATVVWTNGSEAGIRYAA